MEAIKAIVTKPFNWYLHRCECKIKTPQGRVVFHTVHGGAYVGYFITAYVEGHGLYAMMGGTMAIITVVGFFLGTGE